MKAAGLWLPKIRWGYTPPVKGLALPKLPKRMLSAGKRFRDASDALWRIIGDRSIAGEVSYQFATWRDGARVTDWDKIESDTRAGALLEKARAAFRKTAKTCGLTLAD